MTQAFNSSGDGELQRLARHKTFGPAPTPAIGPDLLSFFKHDVQKRHVKFGAISECWSRLIPETMLAHTSLESFSRGQLTVLVDNSSHLFELKQLMLSGLQKQILIACKSAGLRKINLKLGQWYVTTGNTPAERKLRF